jgi:tetratricopeptide repeat protein
VPVTIARQLAERVIDVFAAASLMRHQLAREAVGVRAEAELTVALKDRGNRSTEWLQATKHVKRVLQESVEWYGPDNPLTLELQVLYGLTLQKNSERPEARDVLADAERRIAANLGPDHPLALRARLWTGLATDDWQAASRIFEELLPRHVAVLGRNHPESQLTRYHLGISLAKLNDLKRARPLIAESAKVLSTEHTRWQLWSSMANMANVLVNMPPGMWRFFNWLDDRT